MSHKREISMSEAVDSTSDDRTVNNSDDDNRMRHNYRVLSEGEKLDMIEIKNQGLKFLQTCDQIGTSRELSLAKTKMEEAVMWSVKHITG